METDKYFEKYQGVQRSGKFSKFKINVTILYKFKKKCKETNFLFLNCTFIISKLL